MTGKKRARKEGSAAGAGGGAGAAGATGAAAKRAASTEAKRARASASAAASDESDGEHFEEVGLLGVGAREWLGRLGRLGWDGRGRGCQFNCRASRVYVEVEARATASRLARAIGPADD